MAERSLPITEPTLEVTRFATALAGVAQDARFVTVLGLKALRPAVQHFACEARAAGASHEHIVAALKDCLARRALVEGDEDADRCARGRVLRWALEAYYLAP